MERFICVFIVFLFQYQLNAEVIVGKDFLENAKKFPSVAFVCGKPTMVWNLNTSKWEKDDARDCLNDPAKIVEYCNQKFAGQGFGQFKSVMPWPHEVHIDDWCDFFEPSCKGASPRRASRTTSPQRAPTTPPSLAVRALDEDTEYVYDDDDDDYDSAEQLDPVAVALQTSFSVRPYRCLDSPQQSDTLVVPQGRGCEFRHFEAPGVMEALQAARAPSAVAAPAPAATARRARRQAPPTAAAQTPARPAGCLDYWAWNTTASRLCGDSRRTLYSFVPILPCDAGTFGGVQYVCCADAGAANNAAAGTSSNRRASTAGGAQDSSSEVLGLLMQGEWPLPQPRPNDALRRLLDGDEPTTASPSAPASANANASANTNANDENTNYYVEYMLRPGALGASETARFRNAAQLVRRQHDRLAEQYKAEYRQLVQRVSRENSADANARLEQARKEHEALLQLNDETERNMLELMRQVHRQRIHQEDRAQRANALTELHGELNLLEMLDDEREALKELPFVVRALLHYLRAEEKERIHRINMFEFDEDRDQNAAANERSSLRLALREIAARINQTLRLVEKLPPRLQEQIHSSIDQFLEGYEDVDDEIRVLFPNGLRSAAASAPSGDASAKTKAPYRPKSPPALEGTATPPVTGAGAGVRRRPAPGAEDARINMMPESDYDYDRESGELEIENIEREVEDHVEHDRAAAAAVTARPATARPTATSSGEYDYQIDDSESDESSTSATPFGPHAAIKAEPADVGGSLLPVPQALDVDGLPLVDEQPLAKASVADAVGAAVRAHTMLALLVGVLGVALVAAIATLCCSMLCARRNRMRYRQLQMPTVTTLVETEKEKARAASIDSASLESASLAEAELQLVNQMQINGFENPTYKLFENK